MKFKPILFSTPMVQAILEGRKTMTRRIVKSRHESGLFRIERKLTGEITGITSLDWDERPGDVTNDIHCPYGKVGDVLWVRETWRKYHPVDEDGCINFYKTIIDYAADEPPIIPLIRDDGFQVYNKDGSEKLLPWKPSIFMPKEACRIFLQITDVRVERLQEISKADAISEGIKSFRPVPGDGPAETQYYHYLNDKWGPSPIHSFQTLWHKINGEESWNNNPWVWVISFKRTERPKNF